MFQSADLQGPPIRSQELKRRRNRLVLVLVLLVMFGARASAPQNFGRHDWRALQISVLKLLVQPEIYDGKNVMVKGIIDMEGNNDALCVSTEALENLSYRDCIGLDFDEEALGVSRDTLVEFHARFVLAEGRFSGFPDGPIPHPIDVGGEIVYEMEDPSDGFGGWLRVTRIQIKPLREAPEPRQPSH
jgi:hypothetical protein